MAEGGAPLWAVVALGAAAGGFVQGLSGFAFGLIALGIWAWTVEPAIAGPLVVFGSLIGQVLSFGTVRNSLDAPVVLPFVIGGVLGIPVGIMLLHRIDPVAFKFVVGLILLLWCPAMLLSRRLPHIRGGGQFADGAVGWIGGVMGGLAGLSGVAPAMWAVVRGWTKDQQRGLFLAFNSFCHIVALTGLGVAGYLTATTVQRFAILLPCLVVGAWLGALAYGRVSAGQFRRIVLMLLAASGMVLTVQNGWHALSG